MKVIGKSQDGYLIAATATEIAQLFGHYSANSDEFKAEAEIQGIRSNSWNFARGELVGMEINVGVAYERLAWLERRKSEFDGLVKDLREMADKIDDHRPLFDKIVDGKVA